MGAWKQTFALLVLAVSCLVSSIAAAPLASDFCPSGSGMVDGSCRCVPSQDIQACSDDARSVLKCTGGVWVEEATCEEATHQCKRVRKRSNNEISYRCRSKTSGVIGKLAKRCSKRKLAAPPAEEPIDENPSGEDA